MRRLQPYLIRRIFFFDTCYGKVVPNSAVSVKTCRHIYSTKLYIKIEICCYTSFLNSFKIEFKIIKCIFSYRKMCFLVKKAQWKVQWKRQTMMRFDSDQFLTPLISNFLSRLPRCQIVCQQKVNNRFFLLILVTLCT